MSATSTSEYGAHVADVILRGGALGAQIGNAARSARIALQQQEMAQQELGLRRAQLAQIYRRDSWDREMDTAKLALDTRRQATMESWNQVRGENLSGKLALAQSLAELRGNELTARIAKTQTEAGLARGRLDAVVAKGRLDERRVSIAEELHTSTMAMMGAKTDSIRQQLSFNQELDPLTIAKAELGLKSAQEQAALESVEISYAPVVMDAMDRYKRRATQALSMGGPMPEFDEYQDLVELQPLIPSTKMYQTQYAKLQAELAGVRNGLPPALKFEAGANELERLARAAETPEERTQLEQRANGMRAMARPKASTTPQIQNFERLSALEAAFGEGSRQVQEFKQIIMPGKSAQWGTLGVNGKFKLNEFKDSMGNLWVQSGPNSVRMVQDGRQKLALIKYQALLRSDLPDKAKIAAAETELEAAFSKNKAVDATKAPGLQPLVEVEPENVSTNWDEFLRMPKLPWINYGEPTPAR